MKKCKKHKAIFHSVVIVKYYYGYCERCDEVIIKPTDSCNNMMSQLLATNPENKGLIIYSDIEHFLTAIFLQLLQAYL